MAILNERIKERRLSLNLTLLEVAEFLGVKEATAQRYESGDIKNIKHETIVCLAELFNCSPAYLMGWEEKNQIQNQISKEEQNHLRKYRFIDNKGKHTVDTVLKVEYDRCVEEEKLYEEKPHLILNAAHAIEGGSQEGQKRDMDMMKNDELWED